MKTLLILIAVLTGVAVIALFPPAIALLPLLLIPNAKRRNRPQQIPPRPQRQPVGYDEHGNWRY